MSAMQVGSAAAGAIDPVAKRAVPLEIALSGSETFSSGGLLRSRRLLRRSRLLCVGRPEEPDVHHEHEGKPQPPSQETMILLTDQCGASVMPDDQ